MKIKKAMILAAGYGKRMLPITEKIPKPLIKIGDKNLLENTINLLKKNGVDEIIINTHYLGELIDSFLRDKKNFGIKIFTKHENEILNTGGGIFNATTSFENEPFLVINPDTIWNEKHLKEFKELENLYFKTEKASLLLVDKKLSYDKSFRGDFNIEDNSVIKREKENQFIFTGVQIIKRDIFKNINEKIFSMNKIWDKLILEKNIVALKSKEQFFHINNIDIYKEILLKKNLK